MKRLSSRVAHAAVDAPRGQWITVREDRFRLNGPAPLGLTRTHSVDVTEPRGAVLLVHGFAQNSASWHLSGRSLRNFLAREGFEVFTLDLRGHGASRALGGGAAASMVEHLEDLAHARQAVHSLAGRSVSLVGHSMGGLLSVLSAAESPSALCGVAALVPPYRFARGSWFLRGFSGAAHAAGLLGTAFATDSSAPVPLPLRAVGTLLQGTRSVWDSPRVPLPVRVWKPGSFEPEVLRQLLAETFDHDGLGVLLEFARLGARGEALPGRLAKAYHHALERFEVPLLVVAGTADQLAPPSSVRPAFEEVAASEKAWAEFDAGHSDLLLGRQAPQELWPLLRSWLQARG